MGLFSSKYKTIVGTVIQPAIDKDKIVDPFKLAMIESTIGKVDLIDNLLETSLKSLPIKANQFYNYVKNKHPNKMTSAEVIVDTRFSNALENYIRSLYPAANVQFTYTKFGPANSYHEAWKKLIEVYKFNPQSGLIDSLSNSLTESRLKSVTVELPQSTRASTLAWETENWILNDTQGSLGYFLAFGQMIPAYSNNPVLYSNSVSSPRARVAYIKKVNPPENAPVNFEGLKPSPVITEEVFYVPLTLFGSDKEYYHSSFTVGSKRHFFMYEYGSGGIPVLDNVLEQSIPDQKVGMFFPNIYYRLNKSKVVDPIYAQMARRLGLDHKQLSEGIDENPDITDVDLAAFSLGIDADTVSELELRYLFDFFNQIQAKQNNSVWSTDSYLSFWFSNYQPEGKKITKKAIYLQDDVFKYALTFESITKRKYSGSIGNVNYAEGGKGFESRQRVELSYDFEGAEVSKVVTYSVPYRWYKKQISLSFWEEIRIYDLTMVYTVTGDLRTTLGDEDNEICLIPLDRAIIKSYSTPQQQELYSRAFNFIFNSIVIQKIKWYQRGIFKALLVIVAAVIAVYTANPGAISAAYAVGGAVAVMSLIVNQIIINIAIQIGITVFVNVAGPEFAFLAALAATAYGFLGFDLAFASADQILSIAVSALKTAMEGIFQGNFLSLQQDMESFLALQSSVEQELQRASDLLSKKNDPAALIILGETATDFLYRTTVFGTSGLTKINDVSTYVDKALYLPTTSSQFNLIV